MMAANGLPLQHPTGARLIQAQALAGGRPNPSISCKADQQDEDLVPIPISSASIDPLRQTGYTGEQMEEIKASIQPLLDSCEAGTMRQRSYRTLPISDDVPVIPLSCILNLPSKQPKRQTRIRPVDEFPDLPYGDPIIQKQHSSTRLFFQNV
jgi:hypothetical protein